MVFFKKLSDGFKKTRESLSEQFEQLGRNFSKIDEDFLDELEEILITSDVGVETSMEICENIRNRAKKEKAYSGNEINDLVRTVISEMMDTDEPMKMETPLSIILVIGVNGVGKTTSIGKLANKLSKDGKKVMLSAADTFRAAAIEQLDIWAKRCDVDIIKHQHGSDPAAVVFDSIIAAKSRNTDVLIIDTAGRLHNKSNLMEELAKINRVIMKEAEGCDVERLLVLDASTGQNAVNQAKQFKESAGIDGIILTKLDGTAKGGIVISIKNELKLPVRFIGVGEQIDDLQEFNSKNYAEMIFNGEKDESNSSN